ncbi:hypothetical protein P3X46_027691 [Hevea brasiliensis]|uniref:F-box associated beta-propeller type 1 domain-containing protein n=1 Tax=Hevea brasiliensis TaxID=3981 RepID=A0ABQ9L0M2_HEVBR|nr:hypothetical protein P3X46_027691 [Hevea brasiliensis]
MLGLSIGDDHTLVLWNLSIGDCRTLPLPKEIGICGGVCGLGFDSRMDDYKVVSFCENQVLVFSMKRNLWRNLGELPYSIFYEGVPANGCLYWAASKTHKFADRILRLNLSDETFREVTPPFDPSISRPIWFQEEEEFIVVAELNLLLWGDSLCVFRQYDHTVGNEGGEGRKR